MRLAGIWWIVIEHTALAAALVRVPADVRLAAPSAAPASSGAATAEVLSRVGARLAAPAAVAAAPATGDFDEAHVFHDDISVQRSDLTDPMTLIYLVTNPCLLALVLGVLLVVFYSTGGTTEEFQDDPVTSLGNTYNQLASNSVDTLQHSYDALSGSPPSRFGCC
eukprot:TRINITY_DN68699_c0_g1_i1.p1 TRINITY_DN68699_c0_g1~~TRINITY_DN68699_c0_g1_i1.p1  ORF type:complete len:165 (+),score=31.54 TRINITY_DN68699_c0_g1_i1:138-632(+)